MCLRCDGYSEEEVERSLDLGIRVNGWTATQISDDGERGWTYTLGMNERLDHPDLIILDAPIDIQAKIVSWLADKVCDDGDLDERDLEGNGIELLPVHPGQLTGGLVAQWSHRYRRFPAGTLTSTSSPSRRPIKAFPMGEAKEILPWVASTSLGSTIR